MEDDGENNFCVTHTRLIQFPCKYELTLGIVYRRAMEEQKNYVKLH